MSTSAFVVSLLIFVVAVTGSDDENQAKIRFYHNSMDNYTELPLDESHKMFLTGWYNSTKLFCLFTHGFTGHPKGPAVIAVISALLEKGACNVALLNWEILASQALSGLLNSYLYWAIPNALKLGDHFSKTLLKYSDVGLDLNKTHFIAHSLGAHLFGVTGNKLMEKGIQLPWITALDPATGLDMKPPHMRLNSKSALFTSAIHSDPNKYGSRKELGLVNFWPNYRALGPVKQPGCTPSSSDRFTEDDFCSHHRSWKLFVDAIQNPGTILGSHATSFKLWKRYSKEQREANILDLVAFNPNALPGNYYLRTGETAPYGFGLEGLKPERSD